MLEFAEIQDSSGEDYDSCYLCCVGQLPKIYWGMSFVLKPHLGLGLPIHSTSTQQYLFVIKNERMTSFLDLIEILSQRLLAQLIKKEKWIFNQDYKFAFCNDTKMHFIWVIDQKFEESAKILGLWQINFLLYLQQFFSDSYNLILHKAVVMAETLDPKFQFLEHKREDHEYIWTSVRECLKMKYKVVVSGTKEFYTKFLQYPDTDVELFENILFS